MSVQYYVDSRGLPAWLDQNKQKEYTDKLTAELEDSLGLPKKDNEVTHAVITGMLLLDEQWYPATATFQDGLQKVWRESLGKTKKADKTTDITNRELYKLIQQAIVKANGRDGAPTKISYQQFGSVARYVVANAESVPADHEDFSSQVRLGLDRYVAGAPAFDSLELPPLTGADGADVEVEGENVKAVGLVYAAHQLEKARLFNVVDRLTELFQNGMLPIGYDAGGKALDTYCWNAEDRLSDAARFMQYGRVLGAPGADVSKEVQPNRDFESLFLRFLSSLAEYDRQRRVADILDSKQRSLSFTSEQVRKAGRDLAANCSLYGWGGTHFAARRLKDHIVRAFDILNQPSIQKAYGVSNPWQLVERVAAAEFGQAPNIVKYRTMAEAGNGILDIVASKAKVWSATTGNPLFDEQYRDDSGTVKVTPGDIRPPDDQVLMRHVQYWLAVNGIADEQVDKLSQPTDTASSPSMPTPGLAKAATPAGDGLGKLQQMVASGTAPTLDQLKQLLPAFK